MTVSMTGFASRQGAVGNYSWTWELRSVNGRGLDLRLRLPDWISGLEQLVRAKLQNALHRGNVQLSLKVTASAQAVMTAPDAQRIDAALAMIDAAQDRASLSNIALRPSSAAEVLALRGVLDGGARDEDTTALKAALEADLEPLIADLKSMRATEGAALQATIEGQLNEIESLHEAAVAAVADRAASAESNLREQIARVTSATDVVDPDRLAQELALLAVKADVTEELDRLTAHIAAARDLLAGKGPLGRKFDFLVQEFNREANTLCSKSGSQQLTAVGLDMKATIDQMREQVQNVE